MVPTALLYSVIAALFLATAGQEAGLPDYVVSECYGDIFNFDCGPGNKIRINRDFFGYSNSRRCQYMRDDCIISNPKSNSLIHRFCTGHRVCTYYMVERRGCGGYFSNYQQVEYQCIPDSTVTDVCSTIEYEAESTYIASPNFPENYPPNLQCRCVVSSATEDAKVQMEIVYLAIKYTSPCRDWLGMGRRRTCGTTVDLFQGWSIPIEFHSDGDDSHSGFWLHFQSSKKGGKVNVRCGNATSGTPKPKVFSPTSSPTTSPIPTGETTTPILLQANATISPRPAQDLHVPDVNDPGQEAGEDRDYDYPERIIDTHKLHDEGSDKVTELSLDTMSREESSIKAGEDALDDIHAITGRMDVATQDSFLHNPVTDLEDENPRLADIVLSATDAESTLASKSLVFENGNRHLHPTTAPPMFPLAEVGEAGLGTDNTYPTPQSDHTYGLSDELYPDYQNIQNHPPNLGVGTSRDIADTANDYDLMNSSDISDASPKDRGSEYTDVIDWIYDENEYSDRENEDTNSVFEIGEDIPQDIGQGNDSVSSTPLVPGADSEEDQAVLTLGLIILCVCIGVGIFLVCLVLLTVYCKRKRTVNEQTQTQGISKHTTSTSIGDMDGDSGQGLLVASQTGSTSGLVLDVEALYAKPRKADKSLQIDVDGDYDDVMPTHSIVLLESDSDSSSLYCNPYMDDNNKGVQVTARVRKRRTLGPPTRPKPRSLPKRHIMELDCSLSSGIDLHMDVSRPASTSSSDYSETDPGTSLCRITDSDLDDFSCSEAEMDTARKKSLASMSELAEVTLVPENTLDSFEDSLGTDWDQRSGISI